MLNKGRDPGREMLAHETRQSRRCRRRRRLVRPRTDPFLLLRLCSYLPSPLPRWPTSNPFCFASSSTPAASPRTSISGGRIPFFHKQHTLTASQRCYRPFLLSHAASLSSKDTSSLSFLSPMLRISPRSTPKSTPYAGRVRAETGWSV